ncbi:anti-repressor SinI family protein [Guptibacillus algicola]|nr:anti-repressor SinI family protein [Alkalihalobacillus algicola]MCA0987640.1 anti-repressor SinI family protein [Alkalihalobacillus algicola]
MKKDHNLPEDWMPLVQEAMNSGTTKEEFAAYLTEMEQTQKKSS